MIWIQFLLDKDFKCLVDCYVIYLIIAGLIVTIQVIPTNNTVWIGKIVSLRDSEAHLYEHESVEAGLFLRILGKFTTDHTRGLA